MTASDLGPDTHWLFLLRAFTQQFASRRRDFKAQPLTPLERSERQIIGGALLRWFRDDLPAIQSNRAYLSALDKYPALPFLLIETTPVGLDAVQSALNEHPRLFALSREELRAMPPQALPPAKAMVHYWSYIEAPEGELARQAQLLHLNVPLREMVIHRVGHRFNERAGNEAWHLWRRDDEGYTLLTENLKKATY